MAENNYQNRMSTSTQIRNMYSDGLSYMNIKFFLTNLSFQLAPFTSKDATGRSNYDQKQSIMTTVNFDGAFALYQIANDIIQGKDAAKGANLSIQCAGGTVINLDRKPGQSGQMETMFSITKNNTTIQFRFNTHQVRINENGQMVTKTIEVGLGTFTKTLEGYLTGINANRHLNKLTDDYVKSKEGQPQQGGNNSFQTGSGYQQKPWQNNGGYKKPWNNNGGGYKKPWQNNNNQGGGQPPQQASWESKQPNQQDMSTYQIQG